MTPHFAISWGRYAEDPLHPLDHMSVAVVESLHRGLVWLTPCGAHNATGPVLGDFPFRAANRGVRLPTGGSRCI
jgi:hypothetical protein